MKRAGNLSEAILDRDNFRLAYSKAIAGKRDQDDARRFADRLEDNLFGGSGSTLISAVQNNRHAFLTALDPPYCDVVIQRWERFTGSSANLASKRSSYIAK